MTSEAMQAVPSSAIAESDDDRRQPGARRARRRWRGPLLVAGLQALAVTAWVVSVAEIRDGGQASSGWGLVAVTGFWWPLAALAATAAAGVELAARALRAARAAWSLGLLALVLYGTQPLGQGVARLPTVWLHAAFVSEIAGHGQVIPHYDARFAWPGFFSYWALVQRFAGLGNLDPILNWAPLVTVLLVCLPVFVTARHLSTTKRGPWYAVLVFLLANWIEQEYFSPQASSYLLAQVVIALSLTFAAAERSERATLNRALWLCALVVFPALAMSHQLTPYALALQLAALALAGRLRARWLPAVCLLWAGYWFVVGAQDFWTGHLHEVTGGIGQLSHSVAAGVVQRIVGDTGQLGVKLLRVGLTVTVAALAAAGIALRWRRRQPYLAVSLAAAAPAAMVALQPYGGEVLMRVVLFALPFLAVLAGDGCAEAVTALCTRRGLPFRARSMRLLLAGLVALVIAACAAGLPVARGGNDAYVSFTPRQITLLRSLIASAPKGAKVMGLTEFDPLRYGRLRELDFVAMSTSCVPDRWADCVIPARPSLVITTQGQDNYGALLFGAAPGWTGRVLDALVADCGYSDVVRDRGLSAVALTRPADLGSAACARAGDHVAVWP